MIDDLLIDTSAINEHFPDAVIRVYKTGAAWVESANDLDLISAKLEEHFPEIKIFVVKK